MKKTDYIVVVCVCALLMIMAVVWRIHYSKEGFNVSVTCNNNQVYYGPLEKNVCVVIEAGKAIIVYSKDEALLMMKNKSTISNIVVIEQGKADVISASCPDKICVNSEPVNEIGKSIVCMPNRVVVTVEK